MLVLFNDFILLCHVWYSQVEIGYYSVVYFDHIAAFEVLLQELSLRAELIRATRLISYSCTYTACMSPTLKERSAPQHFACGNAVKIRNWIMFYFYLWLPHADYYVHIHITAKRMVTPNCEFWQAFSAILFKVVLFNLRIGENGMRSLSL